ncbi:lipoprotein LpqQ [Mycobacteroides abscessus subsp. bolletii]|nr:lipoprotein LpqQ [Mycobacteroides abscessus subsp. bolletii]
MKGGNVTDTQMGPLRTAHRKVLAALVVAVVVPLIAGCTSAQPTATRPPVSNSADFTLSLEEAQRLVHIPVIADKPVDEGRDFPRTDHRLDDRMSAPCRSVFNQDDMFGHTWSNFRNLGYFGYSNVGLSQSIAVYPELVAAKEVFDALRTNLKDCAADFPVEIEGDPYVFTEVDARTLMTQYPGSVNGAGSVHLYRLDSQIVIDVGTYHQGTEPNGAQQVLQAITAKIHSAA